MASKLKGKCFIMIAIDMFYVALLQYSIDNYSKKEVI